MTQFMVLDFDMQLQDPSEIDFHDVEDAFDNWDQEAGEETLSSSDDDETETVAYHDWPKDDDCPESVPDEWNDDAWSAIYAAQYQVFRTIHASEFGFTMRLVRTRTGGYYGMVSSYMDGTTADFEIPSIHTLVPMLEVYLCAEFGYNLALGQFHTLGYSESARLVMRETCIEIHCTYERMLLALGPREGE